MTKGKRSAALRARIGKAAQYKFSVGSTALVAVLVLVLGVGIGATTNVWNSSLRTLGLKPNVPALDFSSLEDTYEQLASHYDGTVDQAKVLDGARHGLVSALGDPYTVFFNASEAKDFSDGLSGKFSGIGAGLQLRDSVVTITNVLAGSPAQKAGLQADDKIIAVDDKSTEGWTLEEATSKIRGTAGSTVKLTVLRGSEDKDYTVTRADLTNPSVTSEIKDNIGVLTLSRFSDDTYPLAQKAAQSFKDAGVKGVILDLRGNGGGEVDAAQDVAGLWLNDKLVMTAKSNGATVQTLTTGSSAILNGIPTIVLIDGGSASASEIVASALHDNKAASLYGQKSFGKGSEQSVLQFPDASQLKVTIARWYTPNGKNIDKQGITPDTTITPTADQTNAGEDPVLDTALAKLQG